MTTSRLIAVSTLLAVAVWAADPKPSVVHPAAAPAKPAAKPAAAKTAAQPAHADAQLEAAIRAKFAKSKINEDKFQVHVQGGVATIEGRTDVLQHKGVATRMSNTAGAVAVNNRVVVSDAAKEKASGNLDQGRRRVQIKRGDARTEARSAK